MKYKRQYLTGGSDDAKSDPDGEEDMSVTEEKVKEMIDMSKEDLQGQIDMLKKEKQEKSGEELPGGSNMPIDPELKAMLEGIEGIVKTQADAIGSLTKEREKGKQDEQLTDKIRAETESLKTEIGTVREEVKKVERRYCNEDGTVCFLTKADLEEHERKEHKELEELRAKGTGHPPETIHGGKAGEIMECPDCREPITEAVISRIKQDEEYRNRFVTEECKDKTCRTDLFNHLLKTAEGEEKEKLEKEKKFFLDKD